MFGLLQKLSELDPGAEAAVRVISTFDSLVEGRVSAATLTRATATLAECTAGMRRADNSALRFAADGNQLGEVPTDPPHAVRWEGRQSVWLERADTPHPLDELVLERFALAARVLLEPRRLMQTDIADPALTELLLSDSPSPEDRARAIGLLGLDPSRPLRVVAVTTSDKQDPGAEAVALIAGELAEARFIRVATIGSTAAVILQPRSASAAVVSTLRSSLKHRVLLGADSIGSAAGTLGGVGGAVLPHRAHQSWIQAQLALKFAVAGTDSAVIDYDGLGAIALLADIPADRIAANADVAALVEHAATNSGRLDLDALDALCRTGSLRQAAALLHMHHSSVATRIARTEDKLGWDVGTQDGLLRARIALQALHFLRRTLADEY